EPRSAPESLGPGPHSHLGHREKECADLMMYRKSEKPHGDPGAAIGRHSSSESPAHFELESRTKGMQNEITSAEVEEVPARQDTEQEG
ncbi:hypothetical protein KUCAC02_010434, partial [Chaenocephalus aceratus]